MDDISLMLRVKAGDWLSFACLMDRHRSSVERFLFHKVGNRALAEDLAQEVFLRIYRARHTYEPSARFAAWLFQIATRLASNSRRDHRRDRLHASLEYQPPYGPAMQIADVRPSIEQALLADVAHGEVRRAIATLPEKQRTAVMMHKFDGLDYAAIACHFGCTESAVKSLMFRAHEALRTLLAHVNAA